MVSLSQGDSPSLGGGSPSLGDSNSLETCYIKENNTQVENTLSVIKS